MGDCVMTFQIGGTSNLSKASAGNEGAAPSVRVAIPPRSLLVLRGAARYTWQHGIPEPDDFLSDRRLAIIFRRVKGVPDIAMASTPDVDDSERVETSKGIKANDEASVFSALEAAGNPQLVLFDGFNAEERFGHYVREKLPDAMRILDMQDFHALRLGRERLIAEDASAGAVASYLPTAFDEDLQRELAAVHRCDVTLAISEHEKELLVDTYGLPSWKVVAAPFGFDCSSEELPSYEERRGAMFIGNWRHRPNRDCAKWLIEKVWPAVRQRLPKLKLSVYGANQTPEDAALTQENVGAYVRGYCRSVEKAMQQHRLLVAPLRYGAGVKGKVLEAMQHGLVVVTTPVGVEGIAPPDEFPGYVVETGAEDPEAFADAIAEALRDPSEWEVRQRRASALLAESFDATRLEEELRDYLRERWQRLAADRQRDFVGQMLWHSSLRSTQLMAKYIAAKEQAGTLQQTLDK
ncbi:unnamed protein product [Symbiodinium pilosum]|uniref:Glycosyltransferase n=1 Tax=Symbiodinium pilosum TaxID=2952 RepID=A0A812RRH6_SYMPI|nr:unnamed protein product [Symbiodinium pilosum]